MAKVQYYYPQQKKVWLLKQNHYFCTSFQNQFFDWIDVKDMLE